MANAYFSQDLSRDTKEVSLLQRLTQLDDSFHILVKPWGNNSEDYIVVRSDGVHYVRHVAFDAAVETGPRFGVWKLANGVLAENPYISLSREAFRLKGQLSEYAPSFAENYQSRKIDFVKELFVFPVLYSKFTPNAVVEPPTGGKFCRNVDSVEKYFTQPHTWQSATHERNLKLSRMEIERIARLLGYVKRNHDQQTATVQRARRIPDGYEFAREVAGQHFFGRKQELLELQDLIRTGKHVSVFGLQRVGKTSLIKEGFRRAFPEATQKPLLIEINLQRLAILPGKFPQFLEDFVETVILSVGETFGGTSPSNLGALQKQTIEYLHAHAKPHELAIALNRFLLELRKQIGRNIAIFIDELQVLGESAGVSTTNRIYHSFVRALGDTAKDAPIQFLFSGRFSVLGFNEEFDWQLLKLCKKIELRFLDDAAARELIVTPSQGYLSWDDTAIRRILELTGGHPYLIQYICSSIVGYANNNNANRVMEADVNKVVEGMIQSKAEEGTIRLLYSDFETTGLVIHDVIARLAVDKQGVEKESIAKNMGRASAPAIDALLNDLSRVGLVETNDGRIRLRIQLLREYCVKHNALPIGPHLVEKSGSVTDELERLLAVIVVRQLKKTFGDSDDGWWRQGIPVNIRKRVATTREEDKTPVALEGYFFITDYKDIIEQNWTLFESIFCEDRKKSKSDNLSWIVKFSDIRRVPAHPTRAMARGSGLTSEEKEFVSERYQRLQANSGLSD